MKGCYRAWMWEAAVIERGSYRGQTVSQTSICATISIIVTIMRGTYNTVLNGT